MDGDPSPEPSRGEDGQPGNQHEHQSSGPDSPPPSKGLNQQPPPPRPFHPGDPYLPPPPRPASKLTADALARLRLQSEASTESDSPSTRATTPTDDAASLPPVWHSRNRQEERSRRSQARSERRLQAHPYEKGPPPSQLFSLCRSMTKLTSPLENSLLTPQQMRRALGQSNDGRQQQRSQTGFTAQDLASWQTHLNNNAKLMGMERRRMRQFGRMQQAQVAEAEASRKEKEDLEALRQEKNNIIQYLEKLDNGLFEAEADEGRQAQRLNDFRRTQEAEKNSIEDHPDFFSWSTDPDNWDPLTLRIRKFEEDSKEGTQLKDDLHQAQAKVKAYRKRIEETEGQLHLLTQKASEHKDPPPPPPSAGVAGFASSSASMMD